MTNVKVFVVEFIGTFALVFVGAATAIYSESIVAIGLAHGLTLAVMVYAFGYISGAHVNPAVTLGLAANGSIRWSAALIYWVAQFAGGALAALALRLIFSPLNPDLINSTATNGALIARDLPYHAVAIEALLTFFLVNTVLHTVVAGKAGPFAGWAIGSTWTIAILCAGPLTGASLNPARSFGPALFTSAIEAGTPDYQNYLLYLIYFVGPFLGSILAVSLYQLLKYEPDFDEGEDEEELVEIIEPEIVEEVIEKPVKKSTTRRSTSPRKSTRKK